MRGIASKLPVANTREYPEAPRCGYLFNHRFALCILSACLNSKVTRSWGWVGVTADLAAPKLRFLGL